MGWAVVYPDMQFIYFNYPFKNPDVFSRFVEGLIKAGYYQKDPKNYYQADSANRLNGQEIKELVFGKTIVSNWSGIEIFIYTSKEGVAEYAIPTYYQTCFVGKSWIEEDSLCSQFKYWRDGVKYCFDIYNNPEGSAIEKNQYLILSDAGITPFSVMHQKPAFYKDMVRDTDIR
jgi:hypothetical protein